MWNVLKDEIRRQLADFDTRTSSTLDASATGGCRIYCVRGCHNCCNLAVQCTFTEALLVAEVLNQERAAALQEHVSRLRRQIVEAVDFKSYLRLHRQKISFCPFLAADGSCGVYAVRPFACRSLLSTRPADWCAVDFSRLHPLERQAFLSSLDPNLVAWPSHYLAASRDLGQELESAAFWQMHENLGFTLSGNLPFLVWLELEFRLSAEAAKGYAAVRSLLEQEQLHLPFLVNLHSQ